MNIKTSACVFPSYRAIQEKVQHNYIKQYQNKIHGLKSHLAELQAKHDFQKDHEQIQLSIMTLSAQNNQDEHYQKEKIKVVYPHQKKAKNNDNGQSLNYFLEDDGQEQNNYETYLKFKKKTLERDLQEEVKVKGSTHQEKKKQKEEQQLFFRKLYVNESDKQTIPGRRCVSANKYNKVKKSNFDYRTSKENANNFLKKIHKKPFQSSKNIDTKIRTSKKIKFGSGLQSEIAAYEKNRKYLTENYLQILKKLDSTNIVKWRVLNDLEAGQ